MSAPQPEPPFPPDLADVVPLTLPEPVHRVRSFVSGDPAGDRLRVAYWAHTPTHEVRARAWFGPDAEGPPGHAHGGSIAAVLDEVMGVAAWYRGHRVVAKTLAIDFVSPLPLGRDTIVFADVRSVEGRRVTVEGRIESDGGRVHTRATGVYVVVDGAMLERFGL
ncbi:MAG: PaaI family thioesterase [Deltaproteobacteria bacterium]|nr:PaaI family thioesterase [Deltaproteobacteria bacterium]